MGKWITMPSGKKVFLATNNPHTEAEKYIIKQENNAKKEKESYNANHHFCNMCGSPIDDLYNKNKSRKLCDPCKNWQKSPHPSWND